MGAFWHLYAPVAVNVTMNKDEFDAAIAGNKTALPEPFAKDFFETSRKEWSEENEFLNTRHKIRLSYMLSDENTAQIKPFLIEAWQLIEAEDPSIIPEEEELDNFIKDSLTPLNISSASLEEMDKKLRDIEDNYYLRYEPIHSMVVYHGWPDELRSKSRDNSMKGFIFLHSYEKMNLIPEETELFFNLRDKIKRELSKRYAIANYIYTLGF